MFFVSSDEKDVSKSAITATVFTTEDKDLIKC